MYRIVSVIVAGIIALSLFMAMAPKAYSDDNTTTTLLGITYPYMKSDITVHLLYVEVSDHQKGNTYPSTPLDRVKWFRLYYDFENRGDHAEVGYIKAEFYDEQGNIYKPNTGTYTGDTVAADSTGNENFIEIPLSKDSNIVKIRITQGFDVKDYDIPQASVSTPTPVPTSAPTREPVTPATATAQPTTEGPGTCLPLLPFAVLSAVGLAGLATGKMLKKNK